MNYLELKAAALGLSVPQREALLASLTLDGRAVALVGWLEANREAFVNAGSRQDIAAHYGKLAHAQGSVHALNVLIAQIAALMKPPTAGPSQTPPDEEQ